MIATILRYIWRFWFYFLGLTTILVLLPFLVLSVLSEKTYKVFFFLARLWAFILFYGMGMRYSVIKKNIPVKDKSYIIIANHTSMLDIMLMLILMKNNPFVFVGKAELAKVPVFGFFYKRTCILVDRGNSKSRSDVFLAAKKKIDEGLSICIFPEGGVNDDRSVLIDDFKDGAFRLALEHQLPILPITIYGLKDFFPFVTNIGHPGRVKVTIHESINSQTFSIDVKKEIKNQAHQLIKNELLSYKKSEVDK